MSTLATIIVLHKTKYGESSVIIHGYSSDNGRCGFLMKKPGKGGALSLLHPLSIIEAELSENPRGDLRYIKSFRSLHSLPGIRESLSKSSLAIYISELIFRTIHEYSPSAGFFSFLVKSILLLEELKEDYANFHIWFLVEFAKEAGYSPEKNYSDGALFDIISASFTKTPQAGTRCFSVEDSAILATILEKREESIHILRITGGRRSHFAKQMTIFLSYHFGFNINIHSLDILHEVFE